MLCGRCGRGEAVVVALTLAHNHVAQTPLCADCASSGGAPDPFDALAGAIAGLPRARAHPARCPSCRASFADFRRGGRFGCPGCYDAFRPQVDDLLPRVHAGAYQHRGKTPGRR